MQAVQILVHVDRHSLAIGVDTSRKPTPRLPLVGTTSRKSVLDISL